MTPPRNLSRSSRPFGIESQRPGLTDIERPATLKGRAAFSRPPPEVVRVAEGEGIRYTRFERARIIGARALQISMGAPLLIDVPAGIVDPIEIADLEFWKRVIPITVKR